MLLPPDLNGQEFVTFDEEVIIRRELERFFRENDIEVTIVMQFDNIQSIKEAVALGSGISILPERTMETEVEQKRLVSIPLHAPELVRPTAIIHRRKKKKKLTRASRGVSGAGESRVCSKSGSAGPDAPGEKATGTREKIHA